jgi:hypothetical protein
VPPFQARPASSLGFRFPLAELARGGLRISVAADRVPPILLPVAHIRASLSFFEGWVNTKILRIVLMSA